MDGNRDKKLPKIRELLANVIVFDGYGGARCNVDPDRPCSYHQNMFSGGNFRRHILTKHPVEAAERGFTACRRRDKSQPIPEFLAKFIETNDAGEVHCRITNDQCRYSLPLFNLKRFQRHVCLMHPWEARQWNMSIEENGGNYPEQHQLILQSVTYDANGIYCRIDPDSNCPYRLPVMNSRVFKLHFVNRHPEQAERNGITGEADEGPTTGRGVRTKALSTLVEENVYMDEEGYHCQLDPGCDYTVQGFCTAKLLDHFRQKHPALARAKGFFERRMSRMETDFNARIRKYAQKDDDGNFHCRIDGDCSFVQRKFSSHTFLRHFRSHHRRAANEKNFFEHLPKLPRKRGGVKQRFASSVKKDRPICEYVQEAKEHGFFANFVTVVKSEFPHSAAGKQSKRRREKLNYNKMVEDCIVRDISGSSCRISDDYCKYRQGKFDLAIFVAHFRKHHPAEAKARGFGVAKHGFKKLKMQEPVDPLAIKEEAGDDEELNPDEAPPSIRPHTSIHQLVEKNTLRVKTDVFCKISTEHCDYSRSEGFDSKDFVRHFRFKHPDEAREKGFFCEANDASSDDTLQHQKTLHCLVAENVLLDEEGIQCMISETACPFFQVTLNVYKFVSHFRSEHPSEAEEKGFLRRQRNRKKRKRKVVTAFGQRQRGSIRVLVEKHVKKNETGIHCSLTEHECQYVQTAEFRYPNFRRHFIAAHPVEARAAGFDVDRKKIHSWTRSSDKRAYRQLIRKCVKRDDAGIHCRIGPKECQYVQKSRYALSNFVRHFKAKHPKEARKKGFFKDEDTQKPKVRPHVDPSLKELIEAYIARDENEVHCRIAQRPCRYVLKATCSYYNVVSHFRNAHPKEAMAAGFFPSLAAASEPDLESVERIVPDEPDARDEAMASFTREESQLENPCPDTPQHESREETHFIGRLNNRQLVEKYIFRDEKGVHCRISHWPCKYVQKGIYAYQNFVRHFRALHPEEARRNGLCNGGNESLEPETAHKAVELEEGQPVDPDLSEDERSNSKKRNLPSLRRLTKNFVFQDSRGVHCRISSMPCKYVQKGGYKYTNFIRHFRSEHTEEAFEAGFVRDHNEASEPELELEREIVELGKGQPVDPDLSEEERLNTKDGIPSFRRLTRKFVFKDSKGFHCHISSVPCRYLQQGEYKYNHFVRHFRNVHTQKAREAGFFRGLELESEDSDTDTPLELDLGGKTGLIELVANHFAIQHTEEASKAGFFKNFDHTSEPRTESVGGISYDSISQDETMESCTTEKSQPENPLSSRALNLLRMKPSLKQLTENHIFRDEEGIHCRIASGTCRYVQTSNYIPGNFARHFRTEHPKEAREAGFFRGLSNPQPEAEPIPIEHVPYEDVDVESTTCEEDNSCKLEVPLVSIPQNSVSDSIVPEGSQPEIPCPDTPCDDPALYCRLCFSVDLPLAPIFSGPDAADNPLAESIEECINVRLTAEDDGWICSECSQKLVDFQQFRQLSRIHDSAVRHKKQRLATTTQSNPDVVHSANEADSFYVEIVKQENDLETHTEPPVTEQPCDDQKPFIELPNGSFSCRMCPQTFPSLGPTMEHFISAHSEAMTHTNSVLAVDYSDKPPFKPVTINNVQYLKCADCDTLTEHGEAIIEHRKRFHAGVKMLPTIRCDRAECEQVFMDNPAYQRHLEICHDVIDPCEGGS
ncbi:hypothetical protein pipiens_009252 [Culex pipiens pipiens]|uniref:ZAD domain-containing protein n=1 Tax=Culex pipiens pipiens TaxID=38569 RepID=A0ABD1DFK7_CULPP